MNTKSKDPATASSNRANTQLNMHSHWGRLKSWLHRLTISTKNQQPIHPKTAAQQLEMLVDLKRLELLIGLEDKSELRAQMDEAVAALGTDLDTQQSIRLLRLIIEQRRKRLNGEPIKLKKSDFLATRD